MDFTEETFNRLLKANMGIFQARYGRDPDADEAEAIRNVTQAETALLLAATGRKPN